MHGLIAKPEEASIYLPAALPCRDIKPENILFDEGILKVADFGLALNTNEENAVTRAG